MIFFSLYLVSPVAQAINPLLTVVAGSSVTIGFYASAVQPIRSDDITWWHNQDEITSGLFDSWKRSLFIPSVATSDNGTYKFSVSLGTGSLQATTAATVELIVVISKTISSFSLLVLPNSSSLSS